MQPTGPFHPRVKHRPHYRHRPHYQLPGPPVLEQQTPGTGLPCHFNWSCVPKHQHSPHPFARLAHPRPGLRLFWVELRLQLLLLKATAALLENTPQDEVFVFLIRPKVCPSCHPQPGYKHIAAGLFELFASPCLCFCATVVFAEI